MRILAAPLLIGLASEVLAENHKDNKSPIVWNDYIVCKGYEDTVVYDDDQTNFDTEKLTIPHPGLEYREFVLIPLYEITSYGYKVPKYGSINKLIKNL